MEVTAQVVPVKGRKRLLMKMKDLKSNS